MSSLACKAQNVNIYSSHQIESTHQIKSTHVDSMINYINGSENYKGWKKSLNKVYLISSKRKKDSLIIRVFTTIREEYAMPKVLKNNYSAYLTYDRALIIYWGNEDLFFTRIKSSNQKKFFEDISLKQDYQAEYYCVEFLLYGNKLTLLKEQYFNNPILEE